MTTIQDTQHSLCHPHFVTFIYFRLVQYGSIILLWLKVWYSITVWYANSNTNTLEPSTETIPRFVSMLVYVIVHAPELVAVHPPYHCVEGTPGNDIRDATKSWDEIWISAIFQNGCHGNLIWTISPVRSFLYSEFAKI